MQHQRAFTVSEVLTGSVEGKVDVYCPFHDDGNASAVMYEDKSFHCFSLGCGISLNLTQLVARLYFAEEGREAMSLARTFITHGGLGKLAVEKPVGRRPQPPSDLTYRVMTALGHLANQALAEHPEVIEGLRRSRGLKDPVAAGIGWLTAETVKRIQRELRIEQGIAEEQSAEGLVLAGICYHPTEDTRHRPVHERPRLFRHQLVLPEWRTAGGRPTVVFYQARATADAAVKYLSPPGIAKPLFGWESLTRESERVWLCEGPFDILPLIEAGEAAVATTGSDLKAGLVQEFVTAVAGREILIAFDRDEAGLLKAPELRDALLQVGARARVQHPPEPYKDMGEWAAAEGAENAIIEIEWG